MEVSWSQSIAGRLGSSDCGPPYGGSSHGHGKKEKAKQLFEKNRFAITRQLRYS